MDDKQRRNYEEQKILLEQFNDIPKRRIPNPSRTERMRKRRRKKRIRQMVAFFAIVAVVLITAILLIVRGCSVTQRDALYGKWNLDGTTFYVFDGNGNGKMELPEKSYDFQYTIQDNTITIDFTDENAKDFTYDFTVENDTLTLAGKEKKETFTYSFKKQNE